MSQVHLCHPRRAFVYSARLRCQEPSQYIGVRNIIESSGYKWTSSARSYHAGGGTTPTTMAQHQSKVAQVAASVRSFYERGEKFRIFHGSTNSTRQSAVGRDPRKVVDTSGLAHVVQVDAEAQTALVEPNVPMDRLVEETLKYGLVPPVVMEFPGITVGGGYSGTSGESSSFKHGFFDRTLNRVEMVLATGEVVTASETERSDLFRGAAGAVGSLAVTTMVELQLRPAPKFVETTYHPVRNMQEAAAKLKDFTSRPEEFDYVDGIMYSHTRGAVITGRMTDTPTPNLRIQRFSNAADPWFYLHVQSRISDNPTGATSELIPLPDYLFRYDRGGFWVGTAAFEYFPGIPFNRFTRWFLDDFLHTRMLYKALHASGQSQHMIVQDLALPYATATEFVERMDSLTGIWPLWLCPLKQSPLPTMHPHYHARGEKDGTLEPMLNIGLWGKIRTGRDFVAANREIESTLQELGGMKWLYAQTYSAEEDFWRDFDQPAYDSLRAKYHAQSLPTVYEKVKVDVDAEKRAKSNAGFLQRTRLSWPWAGLYGLRKAIASGDYLAARDPAWKHWVPRS